MHTQPYLEASVVGAEFLSQHGIESVEGLLLQAAVDQNADDVSLLMLLQTHPSHEAKQKNSTTLSPRWNIAFNHMQITSE